MKILVHAILGPAEPRGVGRYADELIFAMIAQDPTIQFIVIMGEWMSKYKLNCLWAPNLSIIKIKHPKNRWWRNLWNVFVFPFYVRRINPDVVHVIDTSPFGRIHLPVVSTIHDLAEFVIKGKYGFVQNFARRIIARWQSRASDHIITVSDSTSEDLQTVLKVPHTKITVIPNGVDQRLLKEVVVSQEVKSEVSILYVGAIERTKNVDVLVRACRLLHKFEGYSNVRLIIAGQPGNGLTEVERAVNLTGEFRNSVRLLGHVSDNALVQLYKSADVFVYLSSFEGFGLPVLEAMSAGVPVVCTDIKVFREVGQDALSYSDIDSYSVSLAIRRILDDPVYRQIMVQKGIERASAFSWTRTAHETINVYKALKRRTKFEGAS